MECCMHLVCKTCGFEAYYEHPLTAAQVSKLHLHVVQCTGQAMAYVHFEINLHHWFEYEVDYVYQGDVQVIVGETEGEDVEEEEGQEAGDESGEGTEGGDAHGEEGAGENKDEEKEEENDEEEKKEEGKDES